MARRRGGGDTVEQLKTALRELAMLMALADSDNDPTSKQQRIKSIKQKGAAVYALAVQYEGEAKDDPVAKSVSGALADFGATAGSGASYNDLVVSVKYAITRLGITDDSMKPDAADYFKGIPYYGEGGRRRRKTRKSKGKSRKTRRR